MVLSAVTGGPGRRRSQGVLRRLEAIRKSFLNGRKVQKTFHCSLVSHVEAPVPFPMLYPLLGNPLHILLPINFYSSFKTVQRSLPANFAEPPGWARVPLLYADEDQCTFQSCLPASSPDCPFLEVKDNALTT